MLYKAPNGSIVSRPRKVGNTFIGANADISEFGYIPVTPSKPTDAPEGKEYVASGGQEVNGEWQVTWTLQDAPAPVVTYRTRLTRLEFRDSFTMAEKQALYTAAQSSVDIQIFLDDVKAAEYIEVSDFKTITGLGALVDAGLLTTERAAAILQGIAE